MAEQAPGDTLVMGAAMGLPLEQVKPFLKSLRAAGYSGRVVLFMDRALERRLRNDPISSGVTCLRARQWPPFKQRLLQRPRARVWVWSGVFAALWMVKGMLAWLPGTERSRQRRQMVLAQMLCTPMEARFLRYWRFLQAHPHDRVLLTDVRDVLFQHDPFLSLPRSGLAVSIESPSYTIATENHNAAWVERTYGAGVLARIGNNRVSCVGVTYGDGESIMNYLELMAGEILGMTRSRAGLAGADTAVHNVLLWTDRLGPVHLLETLASPIATLNGIDERELELTARDTVLNPDGSEPSVVHQYDRFPRIGPRLLRALAG